MCLHTTLLAPLLAPFFFPPFPFLLPFPFILLFPFRRPFPFLPSLPLFPSLLPFMPFNSLLLPFALLPLPSSLKANLLGGRLPSRKLPWRNYPTEIGPQGCYLRSCPLEGFAPRRHPLLCTPGPRDDAVHVNVLPLLPYFRGSEV